MTKAARVMAVAVAVGATALGAASPAMAAPTTDGYTTDGYATDGYASGQPGTGAPTAGGSTQEVLPEQCEAGGGRVAQPDEGLLEGVTAGYCDGGRYGFHSVSRGADTGE